MQFYSNFDKKNNFMKRFCLGLVTLFALSCNACAAPTQQSKYRKSNLNLAQLFAEEKPVPDANCEPGKGKCVMLYRFEGEVSDDSVEQTMKWIDKANENGAKAIILELSSPGGDVDSGWKLIKKIENNKTPISCSVDTSAISMAFATLQSCKTRFMTKRSVLMAHSASLGGLFGGTPDMWESAAKALVAINNALAEHCARRLSISVEEYKQKTMDGRQFWMNWQDALYYKAVDKVGDSTKEFVKELQQQ